MGACRAGWSPVDIQARYPSTTQSGKCALLGYPPHAIPSSLTPALPSPPAGPHWWLRVWSGQAIHTRPTAHTRRRISTPLCPHSGNRRPLHHPAVRESSNEALYTCSIPKLQTIWVLFGSCWLPHSTLPPVFCNRLLGLWSGEGAWPWVRFSAHAVVDVTFLSTSAVSSHNTREMSGSGLHKQWHCTLGLALVAGDYYLY